MYVTSYTHLRWGAGAATFVLAVVATSPRTDVVTNAIDMYSQRFGLVVAQVVRKQKANQVEVYETT